jgi:L-aminopeptidase/D-esterase-like protein
MYRSYDVIENKFTGNTTIGTIITNAAFNKSELCKIAGMTHNGYARAIRPVHTSADGDSIYALSVGNVAADKDMVGTLAADVMAEAILAAVKNAASMYGYPASRDLKI